VMGLKAAERYSTDVRGPFVIETIWFQQLSFSSLSLFLSFSLSPLLLLFFK
jgi:hypothetical protein